MSASGSYQLVSRSSKYKLKTLTLTLDSRLCTSCPIAPAFGITPLECAGNVHTMVIKATDECWRKCRPAWFYGFLARVLYHCRNMRFQWWGECFWECGKTTLSPELGACWQHLWESGGSTGKTQNLAWRERGAMSCSSREGWKCTPHSRLCHHPFFLLLCAEHTCGL